MIFELLRVITIIIFLGTIFYFSHQIIFKLNFENIYQKKIQTFSFTVVFLIFLLFLTLKIKLNVFILFFLAIEHIKFEASTPQIFFVYFFKHIKRKPSFEPISNILELLSISNSFFISSEYFDLFEEKLAEYGLPLELKYLACIESGLRPQVKSKAGALGLWQFMYRTGLYYGLEETSYIDERMDPQKATDAACRFLKKLYGIYGDWNLALAAYNAGPGTINRAIERSGNQRSYWAIRSSLPSETQGYVPTFIAAAYLMTFHAQHNLMPAPAKIHNAQLDTMCLKRGLHMSTIAKALDWELQQIKDLNPIYKTEFIPASIKKRCVTGPLDKITLLVGVEDSLYLLENPSQVINSFSQDTTLRYDSTGTVADSASVNYAFHKVKTGETLKSISLKYSVSTDELMEWNALQTTNVYVGQRLTLKKINTVKQTPITPVQVPKPKKYYTVKAGDTLSKIAVRYGLSLAQLKKLNPGAGNMIRVGERIRVK